MLMAAFLAVHFVGLSLGIGGATIADLLILRSIVRREPVPGELLTDLSRVVWAGVAILALSGSALLGLAPGPALRSVGFLAKMLIVAVLVVNGILIHRRVRAFRMTSWTLLGGAVSSVSWYGSLTVAVLKEKVALSLSAYIAAYLAAVLLVWAGYRILFARLGGAERPMAQAAPPRHLPR